MNISHIEVGLDKPFFLIAGPCVIESRELAFETAGLLKEITDRLGIGFVYKSSFDKANRSSIASYRGPGIEEGLSILAESLWDRWVATAKNPCDKLFTEAAEDSELYRTILDRLPLRQEGD